MSATPTRWWVVHKYQVVGWLQCKELLKIRFDTFARVLGDKYLRMECPKTHLKKCVATSTRGRVRQQEWVHGFIHTLDVILVNWYIELEVCRGTHDWNEMAQNFKATFSFEAEEPALDDALKEL